MLTDEEYIIAEAKRAQCGSDPHEAKAWMLTAKTLYPANLAVQFSAYAMEKKLGRVAEAADCLAALLRGDSRQTHDRSAPLRAEIEAMTRALERDDDCFLTRVFERLPPDVRRDALLAGADAADDALERCRLLLLLLARFPNSASQHGAPLVEALLAADAERAAADDRRFARLLAVDAVPLLAPPLSPRLLVRLLVRAIDFFNSYLTDPSGHEEIDEPWRRLYDALALTGRRLDWDPALTSYESSLDRDAYFRRLLAIRDAEDSRQLVYCGAVFLMRALHELEADAKSSTRALVEAFVEPGGDASSSSKRRKRDVDASGAGAAAFLAAADCWRLLRSDDVPTREFAKLSGKLRSPPWNDAFLRELALYEGRFDEALPPPEDASLAATLARASVAFARARHAACAEHALAAFSRLPAADEGRLETRLVAPAASCRRHVRFLPPTRAAVVHYCSKLLLRSIEAVGDITDAAAGNLMALLQLDWPCERALLARLLDAIRRKGAFRYPPFQSYIINVDVLEELTYLWSDQGGNVALDVLPDAQQHIGQRRIGTRGADKGVKEDIKQAMRAQVARCNEPILDLIVRFVTQERSQLLQNCA